MKKEDLFRYHIKALKNYINQHEKDDENMSFTYDHCKSLLDYITNLQEENEKLKLAKDTKCASEILCECLNNVYKLRNEKAIEYIKKHTNHFVLGANKEVDEFDYISTSPKALLNILKRGEDK